ncbi:substrate-binding domain-containing protein [Planktomarina temperata]|nr:substrate-binding domain-containing protein [Planktomarina temperata]
MHILRAAISLYILLLPNYGSAQELRVLTSFPPDFSSAYTAMWQAREPETEIRVLNKNTVAAIDDILRGNSRGFDVFWSSSPEAFELLQRNGALAKIDVCGASGPQSVAPFALSSVGWARRATSTLFMPANWNDLLRPLYRDKIAMARPARSGSTHMLVEQILLVRGWEDGWRFLLELSGNLSTLTARSYGVPDKACDFVRMILSRDGQLALLAPEISRIPFDADVRAEMEAHLPSEVIEALKLSWLDYNARQSSNRYWAVNTLFDIMITDPLVERRNLWRRYHALASKVPSRDLSAAHLLLTTVPVTEDEALMASLQQAEDQFSTQTGASTLARGLVQIWRARVSEQIILADHALLRLEQQASE